MKIKTIDVTERKFILNTNGIFWNQNDADYTDIWDFLRKNPEIDKQFIDLTSVNLQIPRGKILEYIQNGKNDFSVLYEEFGLRGNNAVITEKYLLKFFKILKTDIVLNIYNFNFCLRNFEFSEIEILDFLNKNSNQYLGNIDLNLISQKISAENLLKLNKFLNVKLYLPDKYFPFKYLSNDEILLKIPELTDQPGYRTETGIKIIRDLLVTECDNLERIKIITKKNWRASTNQCRIGQTNSKSGYCKYAVFLDWNN